MYKVKVTKEEVQDVAINHIWIYDRSGSMQGTLRGLVEDMIKRLDLLKTGDVLNIGWFSTQGEFKFILKGHVMNTNSKQVIEKILRVNNTTIGLTCFSEILAEVKQVIADTKQFSDVFSLIFLSDGWPVVNNYVFEVLDIFKAIESFVKDLSSALYVGYGDYYNKALMLDMAQSSNGALIHSSTLDQYNEQAKSFIESASPTVDFSMGMSDESIVAFYLRKGLPVQLDFSQAKVRVPVGATIYSNHKYEGMTHVDEYEATVGAAYIRLQQNLYWEAMLLLAQVGDVALIDTVANVFTLEEKGNAEQALRDAIVYEGRRFIKGVNKDYLPKEDAFCLLDLFNLLSSSDKTLIYPKDPAFKYKRTGVKSIQVEGYPIFYDNEPNPGVRFEVAFHQSRANVSIGVQYKGYIDIGENALGLDQKWNTWRFRNYVLVKDGVLNVSHIPVSTTRDIFRKLKKEGIVEGEWENGKIYLIDLTKIPLINRKYVMESVDAKDIRSLTVLETNMEACLKVFKYYLKELQPEKVVSVKLSDEQNIYLKSKGITHNGFNPPSDKSGVVDYYEARTFETYMDGVSSLPSVNDVLKKLESGKTLTTGQIVMAEYINQWNAGFKTVEWLNDRIEKTKISLIDIREQLQIARFAILVGNGWPSGIERGGGTYDGVVFKVGKEKVNF